MRSLRAGLAASAESAKVRSRTHVHSPTVDLGGGEWRLKEAELLFQRFRDDLRVDLRLSAAKSRQGGEKGRDEITVETLKTVLDQARIAIRATLRH